MSETWAARPFHWLAHPPTNHRPSVAIQTAERTPTCKSVVGGQHFWLRAGFRRNQKFPVLPQRTFAYAEVKPVPGPAIVELNGLVLVAQRCAFFETVESQPFCASLVSDG
jgi:hypothetical protein